MKKKNTDLIILFSSAVIAIIGGSIFYQFIENWSWLDSIYFAVITLTTVGYGDLAPVTPLGKVFTMFYVFIGIGIILASVNAIAKRGLDKASNGKITLKKSK